MFCFLYLYNSLVGSYHPSRLSRLAFLIRRFTGWWKKRAAGQKSQSKGFCRVALSAVRLDVLGVLVPAPLQCHSLSGLLWDGDWAVSAQQYSGITRLFVEEAEAKVKIIACPEHIGESLAEEQNSALRLNSRSILSSFCIDFQIPSCSISKFYPCYNLRKVELLQRSVSFPSDLLLFIQLLLLLLVLISCYGAHWTPLEISCCSWRLDLFGNCSHKSQTLQCNKAIKPPVGILKAGFICPAEKSVGRGCCAIVSPADDADWNCFSLNAACVRLKLGFVLS